MPSWRSQLYRKQARKAGADPAVIANAIATAEVTLAVNPALSPVLTLRHLAHEAGVDYGLLRGIVTRANESPYRIFRIRKRPSYPGEERFRVIAVPNPGLLRTQRWITQRILAHAKPHAASVAYRKRDTIVAAAKPHCGCRWLIKMDVRNFFESISEIAVYKVFRSLGYQALIAFEMTRICTRLGAPTRLRNADRWRSHMWKRPTIVAYATMRMGHLPQGAPTSPMLANLALRGFDQAVSAIANRYGLIYTRYADDLALSTDDVHFSRERCQAAIGEIYAEMGRAGLSPNVTKTRVTPPGARKIVLGLLVDGEQPRLPREFKTKMRQHIHFLMRPDVGPSQHAYARGFASVIGLKHHLWGLVSFAKQVEPEYGVACAKKVREVFWPI